MPKQYKEIVKDSNQSLAQLNKLVPDVMQGFSQLSAACTKAGALDEKTKELIALGIAVAKQCDACIGFHTQKLVKYGATREEIGDVLATAIYMGGGPALMYAADALKCFDEFTA